MRKKIEKNHEVNFLKIEEIVCTKKKVRFNMGGKRDARVLQKRHQIEQKEIEKKKPVPELSIQEDSMKSTQRRD